jgi:hypothetical protein
MIFSCDYVYTYQFVVFKNVKSVLKMKKIKKLLTPRGTAAGSWRHAAQPCRQKCSRAAVGFGDRCVLLEIFGSTIYFLKIKEKI